MHISVNKPTSIGSRLSPGRCEVIIWTSAWITVNWNIKDTFQWNLKRNSYIFIQENAFENAVYKIAGILSRSQVLIKHDDNSTYTLYQKCHSSLDLWTWVLVCECKFSCLLTLQFIWYMVCCVLWSMRYEPLNLSSTRGPSRVCITPVTFPYRIWAIIPGVCWNDLWSLQHQAHIIRLITFCHMHLQHYSISSCEASSKCNLASRSIVGHVPTTTRAKISIS